MPGTRHSNNPIKRFREGYKAQLDRTLAHLDAGDLVEIEPRFFHTSSGRWLRPDAALTQNRFLDVKRWSESFLREHVDDLVEKMKAYGTHFTGGGVVELLGGYSDDIIDLLRSKLPSNIIVMPMFG